MVSAAQLKSFCKHSRSSAISNRFWYIPLRTFSSTPSAEVMKYRLFSYPKSSFMGLDWITCKEIDGPNFSFWHDWASERCQWSWATDQPCSHSKKCFFNERSHVFSQVTLILWVISIFFFSFSFCNQSKICYLDTRGDFSRLTQAWIPFEKGDFVGGLEWVQLFFRSDVGGVVSFPAAFFYLPVPL